jgi:glycosyltransferase involved in cell wall biosynthesis
VKKNGFDIVMLTTAHSATDVRIFQREAKSLRDAGLSVCVIGKYPSSGDVEGVWIEALPTASNRWQRFLLGWKVLRTARRVGGKLFVFHDPELFVVGLLLALTRKKVVYDCHENVPKTVLTKDWIPWPLRWLVAPLVWLFEWLFSRCLAGVMVVTEPLLERFPRGKTILLRNFPNRATLMGTSGGLPVHLRPNIVIYSGSLTRIRGIAELVEAFRTIEGSDAELWMLGEFDDQEFERQILSSLPANVKFLGWADYSEVLEYYKKAKLGVVLFYPIANNRNSLPAKIFEYLGAGIPVVASNLPEWAALLEGCGVQVDPSDIGQIGRAICSLLKDNAAIAKMSTIGRDRVWSSFCWEGEAPKLINFCADLLT